MKSIWDIGHTDIRLFLRRKSSYIWLFGAPFAFIYFTGFANRGPKDPANRYPPLLVRNADTNFMSAMFLKELGAQGMWFLKPEEADRDAGEITIPEDFTDRVLRGEQTKLAFERHGGAGEGDAAILEVRLVRALVALNGHLLEAAHGTNDSSGLTEKRLEELRAIPDPVRLDSSFAGRKPVPSGFSFSLPATLVMYLVMNLLIFGGATVAAERRNGILRRLATTPITCFELVQGKIYGLILLGVVQILFFLAVGRFLFHVNLGANLPGVTATLLVFAWVAASIGVLVGSLTVAEDRVIGICVLSSLLMAALGGCWWPMEIAPPAQKIVALFTPNGWALKALNQLISFGSGFEAALVPLLALVGFGLAANFFAAKFFRT